MQLLAAKATLFFGGGFDDFSLQSLPFRDITVCSNQMQWPPIYSAGSHDLDSESTSIRPTWFADDVRFDMRQCAPRCDENVLS